MSEIIKVRDLHNIYIYIYKYIYIYIGRKVVIKDNNTDLSRQKGIENCWVCEGWNEVTFEWKKGESGDSADDPLNLHLELDNWKPDLMENLPPPKQNTYQLTRMLPPGITKFFFTLDCEAYISRKLPSIPYTLDVNVYIHIIYIYIYN